LVADATPPATLRWFSPGGRYFTVERSGDLAAGFTVVQRHVPTTPGINAYVDPVPAASDATLFYRLRAE